MKILFVYPFCGLGGVETSIINKIDIMRKLGIETEVYFDDLYGEGGKELLNFSDVHLGFNREQIVDLLKREFDFIFVIDYPDFFKFIDQIPMKSRIIFETHISELDALKRVMTQVNNPNLDAILVPTEFNKRMVLQYYSGNPDQIFELPNPINIHHFKKTRKLFLPQCYRKFLGKRNIIWVGRIEENKNPLGFIRLVASLSRAENGLHFIMVGDEPYNDEYKQQVLDLITTRGLEAKLTQIQSIPNCQISHLYSLAAHTQGCLVSTSKNESSPMIFLEAMACHCPIVAPNAGGVGELIHSDYNGKLYPVGDLCSALKAIKELISPKKRKERKDIIENGYLTAMRRDVNYLARRYQEILGKIRKMERMDLRSTPLVSIIMPVYNGADYLKQAIDSILEQSFTNFEFIIINDCSTDQTIDILLEFLQRDKRIRVFNNSHNKGVAFSLNKGLDLARGEYIARMDADDLSVPERLEEQINFLIGHPDYGLVGSWYQTINSANQLLKKFQPFCTHENIVQICMAENPFCHGSVMGRKELFIRYNGYDSVYETAEDYDLWLKILKRVKVANIPKYLYFLRVHENSVSNRKLKKQEDTSEKIRLRVIKEWGLDYSQAMEVSVYWQDRCFFYNYVHLLKGKNILVYGANWIAHKLLPLLGLMDCANITILAVEGEEIMVDQSKYSVLESMDLEELSYDFIVITQQEWADIEKKLLQRGIRKESLVYGFYVRSW